MTPPQGRLTLYSGLREAKGWVGLDSVGICTGPAILDRARAELARAWDEAEAGAAGGRPAETGEQLAARVAPDGILEVTWGGGWGRAGQRVRAGRSPRFGNGTGQGGLASSGLRRQWQQRRLAAVAAAAAAMEAARRRERSS